MSYLNKIVWIDDTGDRKVIADEIGATFIHLGKNESNIDSKLEDFLGGERPKLVILDHFLDPPESQIYKKGSTIAEAVKEKWPECPVIGITAADLGGVNERTRDAYDEFFDYTRFKDHLGRIDVIIGGFEAVFDKTPLDQTKVLALLHSPKSEDERLLAAMPELLKRSAKDSSLPSVVYRWVEHLSDRPGFLFDQLWTATFLGLTVKGFEKIWVTFEAGLYSGVFSRGDDKRWWSSELAGILYGLVDPVVGGNTWHAIRGLKGFNDEDFSKCRKCGKDFPEIVAYEDSQSEDRFAMHLVCTVLHPHYKRELFFEDIRMMDGE